MIGVRCTTEEFDALGERAQACGMRRATYLRTVGLGTIPRERRHFRTESLIYHLTRIGNNLNQLARRHNSNEPVARAECLELIQQLRDTLRKIEE